MPVVLLFFGLRLFICEIKFVLIFLLNIYWLDLIYFSANIIITVNNPKLKKIIEYRMIIDPFNPKQNNSLAYTNKPNINDPVNKCIPIFQVILYIFNTQIIIIILSMDP